MTVLHLIHETAFGGVESAAENLRRTLGTGRPRSSPTIRQQGTGGLDSRSDAHALKYRVGALSSAPTDLEVVRPDVAGSGVNSPRAAVLLLREVRRSRPDVLVTSLWRTVALGWLAKAVAPRTRWAIWVHLPRYTHRLDHYAHAFCLPRADAILCDSEATYEALVRPQLARSKATVPVHIVRPEAPALTSGRRPRPPAPDEPLRLIFWGRMARQKRLDLAIRLVGEIRSRRPGGAELLVIGPDSGEYESLRALSEREGLAEHVQFKPPMGREELAAATTTAHVFVQLSDAEGFAMSAHEALAMGMVCVITPVGDLATDTEDGVDSLHHHGDLARTAQRLTDLASDPVTFGHMQEQAQHTDEGGFIASFTEACTAIARGSRQ